MMEQGDGLDGRLQAHAAHIDIDFYFHRHRDPLSGVHQKTLTWLAPDNTTIKL